MILRAIRKRLLRTYVRVAHKDHGRCQQCQHPIEAGDLYEGFVMVIEGHLRVDKYHMYCPEEWFRKEEEFATEEDERHEQSVEEQLQAA